PLRCNDGTGPLRHSAFRSLSLQRDHDCAEVSGELQPGLWSLQHHRDAFVVAQVDAIDAAHQGGSAADGTVRADEVADVANAGGPALESTERGTSSNSQAQAADA